MAVGKEWWVVPHGYARNIETGTSSDETETPFWSCVEDLVENNLVRRSDTDLAWSFLYSMALHSYEVPSELQGKGKCSLHVIQ